MGFIKRKLDHYFETLFKENTIDLMCLDLETNSEIYFFLELQSYPPIGALINIEKYPKLFKIESLEIQSSKGAFCVARGKFVNQNI